MTKTKPSNRSKLTHILPIILFLTTATLQLSNPIFHSNTHIPSDPGQPVTTDYYHFHWNFWWINQQIQQNATIYETNYLLNPTINNLSLHTLSTAWFPIWRAAGDSSQTITGMILIMLTGHTLLGLTTYALLRHLRSAPLIAIAGGLITQSSSLMFWSSKWTTINLMGWWWLPIALLTWQQIAQNYERGAHTRAGIWALLLSAALWGMTLTDLQYPLFLAFLILPYGLWTLLQACTWLKRVTLSIYGLASITIALILLWIAGPIPFLLTYDRGVLATTPAERAPSILFPNGYFWRLEDGVSISLGAILLPVFLLALVISLRKRTNATPTGEPSRWFWFATAIPPLVLSAGASIDILGVTIPMPYVWLHNLLGGTFRYPERFINVFLFPALVFIGISLSPYLPRRQPYRYLFASLLILLVMLDSRVLRPVPLQPIPPAYDFYRTMGQEDYDYVVVEIPTAGSSGEGIVGRSEWVALQWYGIIHGKRMVNSHISRVDPWHYLWMETQDAMMAWLGQRRLVEPETVRQQMQERISGWPIGYFVIHTQFIPGPGPTLQEIVGFFNSQDDLVCPYAIERDAIVYRTAWHPDGCPARTPPETAPGVYEIDMGVAGDERFIGWGWHWQEDIGATRWRWTGEYPTSKLYVDLPPGEYQLELAAQAFWEPRSLRIAVNGQRLDETVTVVPDTLDVYTYTIPADVIGDGQHVEVELIYDGTIIPAEIGQSADPRKLAIAVDWIRFTYAENS